MSEDSIRMVGLVAGIGDAIRKSFDALSSNVDNVLSDAEIKGIQHIVITGCGDSHMASVGAEMAFEQITGLPTHPYTALSGARYASPFVLPGTLAIGISVSGGVARTREAMILLGKSGATTVGLTSTPGSDLTKVSQKSLINVIPGDSPGMQSYRGSLLALYLLAIRIGLVQGHISATQAKALRDELRSSADASDATVKLCNDKAQELAKAYKDAGNYVFVSHGPNAATALFSAAKVIEAAGMHAMGQDSEEWAHLQYFTIADRDTPTFVITPAGYGYGRAAEMVEAMNKVGRRVVAVVPEGDKGIAPNAAAVLPVAGHLSEAFTPLTYAIPGELFAAHLSDTTGNPPFRRPNEGPNAVYAGSNYTRQSVILEELPH